MLHLKGKEENQPSENENMVAQAKALRQEMGWDVWGKKKRKEKETKVVGVWRARWWFGETGCESGEEAGDHRGCYGKRVDLEFILGYLGNQGRLNKGGVIAFLGVYSAGYSTLREAELKGGTVSQWSKQEIIMR